MIVYIITEHVAVDMVLSDDIKLAQKEVGRYIDMQDIGGSSFIGALIFNNDDELIGSLSYNGQFWDPEHQYTQNVLEIHQRLLLSEVEKRDLKVQGFEISTHVTYKLHFSALEALMRKLYNDDLVVVSLDDGFHICNHHTNVCNDEGDMCQKMGNYLGSAVESFFYQYVDSEGYYAYFICCVK